MKISFKLAWRFLSASRAQTILIITGIAVGIAVQVFISFLIQGLQTDLIDKTIGDTPQITISDLDKSNLYFTLDESLINDLQNNSEITKVNTVLQKNVFIDIDGEETAIILNGQNYDRESDLNNINDKIIEGSIPTSNNEIILGNSFQDSTTLGDMYVISSIDKPDVTYKIVGYFNYDNQQINDGYAYTMFNDMQNNFELENMVTRIETQLVDPFTSADAKDNLGLSDKYKVVTWEEQNASLLSALNSQTISSLFIQVFVIISVVLAIASVLIISVVQKSKQIAILKAMGLNNRSTSQVFLSQGLILGIFGSVAGVALGLALLQSFVIFAVDNNGNPIISIHLEVSQVILSLLIGVLSAVIASLIPARNSKRLTVMEVISNG